MLTLILFRAGFWRRQVLIFDDIDILLDSARLPDVIAAATSATGRRAKMPRHRLKVVSYSER